MSELIAGNKRFVYGRPRYGHDVARAAATANGQTAYFIHGSATVKLVASGGGATGTAVMTATF